MNELAVDDENEENGEVEGDVNSKRGITYQIAKNKGLMPSRKKEQRNPRVKHRNKFRKAKIRRKGAVSQNILTNFVIFHVIAKLSVYFFFHFCFILVFFLGSRSATRTFTLRRRNFRHQGFCFEEYQIKVIKIIIHEFKRNLFGILLCSSLRPA